MSPVNDEDPTSSTRLLHEEVDHLADEAVVDSTTALLHLGGRTDEDQGVFHYEQEHESLEDEVFELHTANKADETEDRTRSANHQDEDTTMLFHLDNTDEKPS